MVSTSARATRRLADAFEAAPDFREKGYACGSTWPDLFYSQAADDIRSAKQICRDCPVQIECATYAVPNEEYGTWGGLSETERARIRRDLRNARRRVSAS